MWNMHLEEARHRRLMQIRFMIRSANEVSTACTWDVRKTRGFRAQKRGANAVRSAFGREKNGKVDRSKIRAPCTVCASSYSIGRTFEKTRRRRKQTDRNTRRPAVTTVVRVWRLWRRWQGMCMCAGTSRCTLYR